MHENACKSPAFSGRWIVIVRKGKKEASCGRDWSYVTSFSDFGMPEVGLISVMSVVRVYPGHKDLRGFVSPVPLDGSRTDLSAVFEGLPESALIGSLITLKHRLNRLPAAEPAEHLERLVHEVRGELPPEGVPAAATLRFQACSCDSPVPPVTRERTAHTHGRE